MFSQFSLHCVCLGTGFGDIIGKCFKLSGQASPPHLPNKKKGLSLMLNYIIHVDVLKNCLGNIFNMRRCTVSKFLIESSLKPLSLGIRSTFLYRRGSLVLEYIFSTRTREDLWGTWWINNCKLFLFQNW